MSGAGCLPRAEGVVVLLLAPPVRLRPGMVLLGCVLLWQQALPVYLHQDSVAWCIHPPHSGVDSAELFYLPGKFQLVAPVCLHLVELFRAMTDRILLSLLIMYPGRT